MGTIQKTTLTPVQEDVLLRALTMHYSGTPMPDVCKQVTGMSLTTYYRWRADYPADYERIDKKARIDAIANRRGEDFSHDSAMVSASRKLQHLAAKEFLNLVPELVRLAGGVPKVIEENRLTKDGPVTLEKILAVYPRDQIAALDLLHRVGKEGVLPAYYTPLPLVEEASIDEGDGKLPINVSSNFSSLRAVKSDGTIIDITVDQPVEAQWKEVTDEKKEDYNP